MIYLFCGDDTKNKHESYGKFIKSIPKSMETFFISKNDFSQSQTESFYSGSGLFFSKCTVIFLNIFEKEDTLDFILKKLDLIAKSNNDFVFLEGKLSKNVLEAFEKVDAKVNNFEQPKERKEKFDNFLLANAFQQKDKLNLWLYYRQAIEAGAGMEELVGVLFWKMKDMILKKDFKKFTEKELKECAGKISYLLPENRKKGLDVEIALERFLLEAF